MTRLPQLHPSQLPLDGGVNFRDLGGNTTADGRRIRTGLLFRAGALDRLTERDLQQLHQLSVRQVLDYRDADEVNARPDRLWQGVRYQNLPANPLNIEVNANLERLTNEMLADFDGQAFMLTLYRRLPFRNTAYQQLVCLLQQPDAGALVQHCAVGKDRTGVGAALVLLALGVDEQGVMEDYLLTETTLAPMREQMLGELSRTLNSAALAQFSCALSANESFLAAALGEIKAQYGSIERWLQQEYGLSPEVREQLQLRYLE